MLAGTLSPFLAITTEIAEGFCLPRLRVMHAFHARYAQSRWLSTELVTRWQSDDGPLEATKGAVRGSMDALTAAPVPRLGR